MGLKKYSKEWLEELCKNSRSYSEVLTKAGRKAGGGNQSYLKLKISEYNIDTSHFIGYAWKRGSTSETDKRIKGNLKYKLEDLLVEDCIVRRNVVRKYILKYKVIPYICQGCGNIGKWNGYNMSLELDHINGIYNDNRIENLRFLCPNRHAITDTYAGKNNKRGD